MLSRVSTSIVLIGKVALLVACAPVLMAQAALAQNSPIQLFGPVNVRLSTTGTGSSVSSGNNFNTTNLNLTCPATPSAILSSTADGTGNLLVDNFLNVTVTSSGVTTGPTNVCPGGGTQSCFTTGYQVPASQGSETGVDPDTLVSTGGVPPIDISQLLVAGPVQVQIALEDVSYGAGFYLASSTLYLDTNCTQGGVTGPAIVNGNPISGTAPTPSQLAQDFNFNSGNSQQIGFEYDLTAAETAGSLTINDGTIPQVTDSPIDPTTFQSVYLSGTSYSTANCVIHSGELLPSGAAACKLFTLQCSVGAGATATGAQCPVSTINNEIFQDVFNGPGFTLSDIPTPSGPTFHEGIGLLMASDTWPGGACTFDVEADLGSLNCPQNLLTSFASMSQVTSNAMSKAHAQTASKTEPRSALTIHSNATTPPTTSPSISTGSTTRPNSTFITVAGIPEDLTTVTVAAKSAAGWNNSSTVNFTLSSQPPNLVGATVPGAAAFVPSPIQSITYGISPANAVPAAGAAVPNDVTLTNSTGCPTPPNLTTPAATVFTPGQQSFTGLADGTYLVHYYAQDCAGTEELQFVQDANGNWSTNFYTYPINVDTTAPVVATGPTLLQAPSAQGTYTVGQAVYASYSCTDSLSGVVQCGSHAVSATNSTGTLTTQVDTSSPGMKMFSVTATDAAGNTSSAQVVSYQVASAYDNQVQFSISPTSVTYPQGANVVVQIVPGATSNVALREPLRTFGSGKSLKPLTATAGYTAITGTVKIYDGSKLLTTLSLQGNGAAYYYLSGLSAGTHSLSATYSGDATIPGGSSAPVIFTVQPAPVTLSMACWNANFPYGAAYYCGAYASSNAGPPSGVISYSYDGGSPVTVPLVNGVGLFNIALPVVGSHKVVVSYAAQGNFAAATPQTVSFTVTPAPVVVAFSPSTYYLTGGNLTLSASIASWSAGPPKSTGSVTFLNGSKVLGVVPVNASGQASITVAATSIANGSQPFTASYAGGTNYASGSTSITVTVAHK